MPVTPKAQQKAENANDADKAEVKSAIYWGFAKAVKNLGKQKAIGVTPSAPVSSLTIEIKRLSELSLFLGTTKVQTPILYLQHFEMLVF